MSRHLHWDRGRPACPSAAKRADLEVNSTSDLLLALAAGEPPALPVKRLTYLLDDPGIQTLVGASHSAYYARPEILLPDFLTEINPDMLASFLLLLTLLLSGQEQQRQQGQFPGQQPTPTLHHISIDPVLLKNFSTSYYEAGHMLYIDEKSLSRLRSDVEKFIQDSLKK
jgi:hypothetical protein